MKKHIEKLQQKPYYVRKIIFYLATGISFAIILGLWVNSLNSRLSETLQAKKIKEEFRPFSLFSKSISNTYTSTREAVGSFSTGLTATVGGVTQPEIPVTNIPVQTENQSTGDFVPEI